MVRRALAALLAFTCAGGASPALARESDATGGRGGGGPELETRLRLMDGASGSTLLACALREGDEAVLTWTNSLFRLAVTERFVASRGGLELRSVTFAEPGGAPPPRARPEDLDDLYHTGGAFSVEGLARPVRRVVFRVGAIGDPVVAVGGTCAPAASGRTAQRLRFLDAVGFGGTVVLDALSASVAGAPEPRPGG